MNSDFNEFIESNMSFYIENYEKSKVTSSRISNTIIQSYNVMTSSEYMLKLLRIKMWKSITESTKNLTEKQIEKALEGQIPIDKDTLNKYIAERTLLETCSFIEFTLSKFYFIIKAIENESEYLSKGQAKFEADLSEEVGKKFKYKKFDCIEYIYSYLDMKTTFNENPELNDMDKLLKYIFYIRNCIAHNNSIADSKLVLIQNEINQVIIDNNFKIYSENGVIDLRIEELDKMITKLRIIPELALAKFKGHLKKYLSEEKNNYIDNLISIYTIQE